MSAKLAVVDPSARRWRFYAGVAVAMNANDFAARIEIFAEARLPPRYGGVPRFSVPSMSIVQCVHIWMSRCGSAFNVSLRCQIVLVLRARLYFTRLPPVAIDGDDSRSLWWLDHQPLVPRRRLHRRRDQTVRSCRLGIRREALDRRRHDRRHERG